MTELLLPTGKAHVSFSEMSCWLDCSYKHKLTYVDGLSKDEYSIHLVFGSAVHNVCEHFIKTSSIDTTIGHKYFDKHLKEDPNVTYKTHRQLDEICSDIPTFMNVTFPGWKAVDAEELLLEEVFQDNERSSKKFGKFKGLVDVIIEAKTLGVRKKDVIWILDWKSCGFGWKAEQKRDPKKRLQLALYKAYWSEKHGIDPKKIRCGFVLLKKQAKPGNHCELVPISVGDKVMADARKKVRSSLILINKGLAMKNRENCKYCEFKGTEHCK